MKNHPKTSIWLVANNSKLKSFLLGHSPSLEPHLPNSSLMLQPIPMLYPTLPMLTWQQSAPS